MTRAARLASSALAAVVVLTCAPANRPPRAVAPVPPAAAPTAVAVADGLSTSADWDLCRRIACHSRIGIVREPLVLYRQHGGSMHRKVEVYERDVLRCFRKMFSDPAAEAVHPLRRRCYGNLHFTLAGSYLHAGNLGKCLLHLARSLFFRPTGIGRIVSAPLRGAP